MNGSQVGSEEVQLEDEEVDCTYHPTQFLNERFWLVSVTGTSVAALSILQNTFLFVVLVAK